MNLKKIISIMILIIAFEVVYLIGFYMPNKVAYGNSEDEIAEEDLKLRGPGDFLALSGNSAIRQSGTLDFKLADTCSDTIIMNDAFTAAREYLKTDPTMQNHPPMKAVAERIFKKSGDIIN